jgi:hypothetical protein
MWNRLYVIVTPRGRVSIIRPGGRADGHEVHPYSNLVLLAFLGIMAEKRFDYSKSRRMIVRRLLLCRKYGIRG